jgi:hypothetical protein
VPPRSLGADRLVPAGVAACALVAGALGVAQAPQLLDSAELAAASYELGVAHPPGEPLALLVGRLFALVPLGSVALRVGLSQVVANAAAAALVAHLALAATRTLSLGVARPLLAAAAGLAFGLAPGALGAALRPEVYALGTALALAAVALAAASVRDADASDPRLALLAAGCIGLGLVNHPLVAGLAGLGAVVAASPLLFRDGPRGRLVGWSLLALAAGASVVLYLPLRLAVMIARGSADVVAWGDARTLRGLWWILSARTFASKASVVHANAEPGALPFVLIDELSLAGALVALAGVYLGLRARTTRASTIALVATAAGAIGAALVGGFDPANPDIRGYLGPAIAALATLAAIGLSLALAAIARARLAAAAAALALAAVAARGALAVGPARERLGRAPDALVGELLASLPASAVLLTGHFETAFLVGYARGVEGRRPDVAWAHLGLGRSPGYAERVGDRDGDLASLLDAHQAGPLGRAPVAAVAAKRPVRLEPVGDLAPDLVRALEPAGLLWSFGPTRGSTDDLFGPPGVPPALASLLEAESRTSREVDGLVAYRAFVDAERACEAGRADARLRVGSLLLQRPDDAMIRALARRCPP